METSKQFLFHYYLKEARAVTTGESVKRW